VHLRKSLRRIAKKEKGFVRTEVFGLRDFHDFIEKGLNVRIKTSGDQVSCPQTKDISGLAPESIGYMWYLQKDGYGDYSLEGLVGERIEQYARKFKMHSRYAEQKKWQASVDNI
jgi:hypothetical protein